MHSMDGGNSQFDQDFLEDEMDEILADPEANDTAKTGHPSDMQLEIDNEQQEEEFLEDQDRHFGLTQSMVNEAVANGMGPLLNKWRCTAPKVVAANEKKRKIAAYQRDYRARKKAERQGVMTEAMDANYTNKEDDSDEDSPIRPTKKRKASVSKRKSKSPEETPVKTLITYIQIRKPTRAPSSSRSKQTAVSEFTSRGPFEFKTSDSYQTFLEHLADTLPCIIAQIPQNSIVFRPDKPTNSREKPLGSEVAYRAMLRDFIHRTEKQGLSMTITMDPPAKPVEEPAFWDTGEVNKQPNFDFTSLETTNIGDSVVSQKMSFDAKNAPIMEDLRKQYGIGTHVLYPDRRVYTDQNGTSWELNDLRLSVWASHINRNTPGVDVTKPPAANCFDYSQRLKPPKQVLSTSIPTPTSTIPTSAPTAADPVAAHPAMSANDTSRDRLIDVMIVSLLQQAVNATAHTSNTASSNQLTAAASTSVPNSAPSSPCRPIHVTLDKFCSQYHLSDKDKERLEELEYTPGNRSIDKLCSAEWKDVGFKTLSWNKVLEAHYRFLKDVKSGVWDTYM
ncbi:hypothetical protein K435DRAFT_873343 [Dendrothele bispora CBS 962.96]|uniref:Uncharacterized protein n=1 Tax=Dendrothele bispora (strain CBS 962.96) TaxID=1314807 RepID=A0A4S8L0J5_DENBC|nr:hypothetical protein K435DRAFT_873343 [Dendrothele bispora CBS 962.96]